MAEIIGETIGNYRIVARLGGGGMGVVYSAEDTRLGRPVAVKFLSEEMARHPQALERFEREARAASALNHPNIATVYDVGTHEGRPYLVMELVEGESLDQKVRGRALETATLVDWGIQIADALDAAHAKGIVHRDVKPANILVNARGQVKVLDFGLAKLAEALPAGAELSAGPTMDDMLTSPGMAVGTVSYMSPEQARGEELDARSDLFSLGCVLYEMATGGRAFTGKTPAVVFHAILELEPAPAREANPALPAKLEEIIAKALEKERELRYQTAAEMRGDLRRLRRDLRQLWRDAEGGESAGASTTAGTAASGARAARTPSTFNPPSSTTTSSEVSTRSAPTQPPAESPLDQWKRMLTPRGVMRLIILAVAATFAIRGLLTNHKPGTPATAETNEAGPRAAPFTSLSATRLTTSQHVFDAAISGDGKYVAYVTFDGSLNAGLSVLQVATRSTVQLVAPQSSVLSSLSFSPDGSFVYYVQNGAGRGGSYYQIPSLGGVPRLVATGILSDVGLSHDGKSMAYVGRRPGETKPALLAAGMGETSAAPRVLIAGVEPPGLDHPSWSPDGKRLALVETRHDPTGMYARVVTVNLADGSLAPLGTMRWSDATGGLDWLPDGSGLLLNARERKAGSAEVWYVSYPGGEARAVTSDLSAHGYSLGITGDGKSFVDIATDNISNLWVAPKGEDKQAREITSGRADYGMAWTTDGGLVYASGASGGSQIWMTDAAGHAPHALTTDAADHSAPTACAGTGRVFYSSDGSGAFQVWSTGLGDGQSKQESNLEVQFMDPDCSADGAWFAGVTAPKSSSADQTSAGNVARLERASGQMRTLFEGEAYFPKISPDGKRIAFFYTRPNAAGEGPAAYRIGVISATGGPLEKSFELTGSAWRFPKVVWAPNGKALQYLELRSGAMNVWQQPVDGGKPKQVTHFSDGIIIDFAWSRDGKTLALARGFVSSDAVLFTSGK